MGRLAVSLAVGALLVTAYAGRADARVLDQSQTLVDPNGALPLLHEDQHLAQTFTAGISGDLVKVKLRIGRTEEYPGVLRVEIRRTSGGMPTWNVLARETTDPANVPLRLPYPSPFISIRIGPAVPIVAGTRYAIVAYATPSDLGYYGWVRSPVQSDPYQNGDVWISGVPGSWLRDPRRVDLTFKTYVRRVTVGPPTRKADCKRGGWKRFNNPTFKNQGRCVSYVNHHDGHGRDND